jgi:molecular chaperone GrpE
MDQIRSSREIAEERATAAPEKPSAPAPTPAVGGPESPPPGPHEVAELEALKAKAAERDAIHEKYLRALAEFDNYQKRTKREQERFREESVRDLLQELLLVLDNLDLALGAAPREGPGALENLTKGVSLVRDQLLRLLANRGANPIDVQPGQPFDPLVHEAVTVEPTPAAGARDEVGTVVRRGFKLGPVLLRPVQVTVRKAGPSAPPAPSSAP